MIIGNGVQSYKVQGGIGYADNKGNYSQYANMVQQMFGKRKNSNDPLAQCDYGNFALRFKPVVGIIS